MNIFLLGVTETAPSHNVLKNIPFTEKSKSRSTLVILSQAKINILQCI